MLTIRPVYIVNVPGPLLFVYYKIIFAFPKIDSFIYFILALLEVCFF